MNPALQFSLLAAAALLAAGWWLLAPLRRTGARRTLLLGLAALLAANGGLYLWLGEPRALDPAEHRSPPGLQELVAGLAARMAEHPDDLQGWLLLGRSQVALGEFAAAQAAYQRARDLSADGDPAALAGFAEARVLEDPARLQTEGVPAFERVLSLTAEDPKALWYLALAATERGDMPAADGYYARLLALAPPAELRTAIEARRAELSAPGIEVSIELASGIDIPEGAALFVYLRTAEQPMPIAAKRLAVAGFPARLRLTAADLLADGPWPPAGDLVLGARLAADAERRSGQPYAEARLPAGVKTASLRIAGRLP